METSQEEQQYEPPDKRYSRRVRRMISRTSEQATGCELKLGVLSGASGAPGAPGASVTLHPPPLQNCDDLAQGRGTG